MTFIDAIAAVVIMSVFLAGFSQGFLPVYKAWEDAMAEYRTAKTIHFVAESFRRECEKPDRNIENWEKMAAASAKELESYEISELKESGVLRALKITCFISGERLEIIGLIP